jgi:hypothetical protein
VQYAGDRRRTSAPWAQHHDDRLSGRHDYAHTTAAF